MLFEMNLSCHPPVFFESEHKTDREGRKLPLESILRRMQRAVFKGHPDFRPYKVSLTRILRFRVGLVGALWLSLQDYLRFVLTFPVSYAVGLRQKDTPLVSQRGIINDSILFSVNCYPFFW